MGGLRLSLALYGSIYVGTGRGVPDKTGPAIQEVNTNSTMEKTCTLKQGPLEMIHLQKKKKKIKEVFAESYYFQSLMPIELVTYSSFISDSQTSCIWHHFDSVYPTKRLPPSKK